MAVPKRKTSKARKRKRRSHLALQHPSLAKCPRCKQWKLPHRICGNCGYYRQQLRVDTDTVKRLMKIGEL